MAFDKDAFLTALDTLTVMELNALVKMIENKFNVSASAFTSAPSEVNAGPVVEAKTEFDVVLISVEATKKIATIKVVRELTQLGLKEAKDLVDSAPKAIKESVSREVAEAARSQLEAAGAVVEVK